MRLIAWLILIALLCTVAASLAGPASPKYTSLWRRATSTGFQWLDSSNAVLYAYPATGDTTGKGKPLTYIGNYLWLFIPDSTYVYDIVETTGIDSLVLGGDNVSYMGPELVVADSAVTTSALRPDPDGRFRFTSTPEAESLLVSYIEPDSAGRWLHLGGHVYTDSLTAAAYLGAVLGAFTTATADTIGINGNLGAQIVRAESLDVRAGAAGSGGSYAAVHTGPRGVFTDEATIGDNGVGDGLEVLGTLSVDGTSTLKGSVDTEGKLTVGNAGTDSLSVFGDLRVRGGDIVAGTAGQAGTVALSDGSSNTTTLTQAAWGSNVTVTLPMFFVDFEPPDPWSSIDGTGMQTSFYVAGIDTSWVAIPVRSADYDGDPDYPTGAAAAAVTRPYFTYCKTDSVVITSHACCDYDGHIFLMVAKKNLWR